MEDLYLSTLKSWVKEHPTQADAAKEMGISPQALSDYIKGKAKIGKTMRQRIDNYISSKNQEENQSKTNKNSLPPGAMLISPVPDRILIPFYHVPARAGHLVPFFHDEPPTYINASRDLSGSGKFYVQAKGNSMIGGGILDGDNLLCDAEAEPRNGDIVIAEVGDAIVVKRLKANGDTYLLNPDNPEYEPIQVREKTRIYGVVLRAERPLR